MVEQQERRLGTWRNEITAEVTKAQKSREYRLLQEEVRGDLEGRLAKSLESVRSELMKELAKQQQRLIAELRAETNTAFRSEAAAVAALDEQLWLTDQRLGQRIDELAHSHREAVAVVERRISSVLQNR